MASTMGTMYGYIYDFEGYHSGPKRLGTDEDIGAFIRTDMARAFMQGREAMVTDSGDNAVFHVKESRVMFAGGADTDQFAAGLRKLGVAQTDLQAKVQVALAHHTLNHEGMER